jgi:hypothetical protein
MIAINLLILAEETIGYPHPQLSYDSHWAGPMLIIIAGMFLAAAVIGPIVRSEAPQEVPPAHSHDEPPGASGHHGPGGMIAPAPEHEHH